MMSDAVSENIFVKTLVIFFPKVKITFESGELIRYVYAKLFIVGKLLMYFFACPKKYQKKTTGNEYNPFPVGIPIELL
jgi:hypothetical protein